MITNASESLRFAELCVHDELVFGENEKIGIGIYNEKRLHRVLKKTLCNNEEHFEVKTGKYIADIRDGNEIIEVQCSSLYPLVQKLEYYIQEGFSVTVVHPIIAKRRIIKADKITGEIKSSKLSPKKENQWSVLPELYWIRDVLGSPKLKIRIMFISADEFRYSERVRRRRSGAYDSSLCPRELLGSIDINSVEDLMIYIPDELKEKGEFTSADYSAISKLGGARLSSGLKALCHVGILERRKEGKRFIYRIIK